MRARILGSDIPMRAAGALPRPWFDYCIQEPTSPVRSWTLHELALLSLSLSLGELWSATSIPWVLPNRRLTA